LCTVLCQALNSLTSSQYISMWSPKTEKVAGGWSRPHNEEIHELYASSNAVRMIKSRRLRWAGTCSTHEGEEKGMRNFGLKTWREENSEDLDVDGRTILDSCNIWGFHGDEDSGPTTTSYSVTTQKTSTWQLDWIEIEREVVELINLTQDKNQWRAFLSTVMNFRVPQVGQFSTSRVTVSFSRRTLFQSVGWLVG